MQFDRDMQGEFSELFLQLRDTLLQQEKVKETLTEKQTSYRYKSRVICMLRGKDRHFTLAFNFGYKLQEKYKVLHMTGKIVAHWSIYAIDDFKIDIFKSIINDSIAYALEADVLAKIQCDAKHKTKPSI